jgi:hypothetical protein
VERRELGQPEGPVGEAEREAALTPPDAQVEASASDESVLPLGPTPAVIDLTSDDPPFDKGKQKADIEMVDTSDQPGTSAALDGDTMEAPAGWPDFAELVLVRAEEELPC